jgi:alkylation response protein AidB-like acyl-CoA dehydrogenase
LLVWAHDTESDKTTAFLLTPEVMADDATLETVPLSGKLGLRALRMSRLAMKDQALGDEHRVGGVGAGLEVLENIMMRDALATAAVALGIGTCAFEAGRTYARERQQFGRAIGEFQAVQWRLADMATKLEAARFVVQHAAWSFDQGAPSFALAAKAKLAACDAALVAADGGVQIHGGYGFISDFPVERCYRDAQVCAALRTDLAASRSRVAQDLLDRA